MQTVGIVFPEIPEKPKKSAKKPTPETERKAPQEKEK